MKKVIAVVISLVLALSVTLTVSAAVSGTGNTASETGALDGITDALGGIDLGGVFDSLGGDFDISSITGIFDSLGGKKDDNAGGNTGNTGNAGGGTGGAASTDSSSPLDKIKELYNLRWNIETAYRHLKYAGNMVHIHSLKKEFLIQEIYGKLTLYNFAAALMAINESVQKKTDKYTYVLNHTQVQRICIRFLRGSIQKVEEMIARFLVPVRPGRKFKRNLRRQSADTLLYR